MRRKHEHESERRGAVLCLIPARRGSQGLRHKNIRQLAGVPLLERAIELARTSQPRGEIWHIVCSTDSSHYARLARAAGAAVHGLRPAHLATAEARLVDVVEHAVQATLDAGCIFDTVLLLACTTPLTRPSDVRGALELYRRDDGKAGGRSSVVSVVASPSHTSWRFGLRAGRLIGQPRRIERRQQGEPTYQLNGAIYIASPEWLRRHGQFVVTGRTRAFSMPKQRSIDIEDAVDLKICEALVHK